MDFSLRFTYSRFDVRARINLDRVDRLGTACRSSVKPMSVGSRLNYHEKRPSSGPTFEETHASKTKIHKVPHSVLKMRTQIRPSLWKTEIALPLVSGSSDGGWGYF